MLTFRVYQSQILAIPLAPHYSLFDPVWFTRRTLLESYSLLQVD